MTLAIGGLEDGLGVTARPLHYVEVRLFLHLWFFNMGYSTHRLPQAAAGVRSSLLVHGSRIFLAP